MQTEPTLRPSEALRNVRYEIRGKLAQRAHGMERQGYEIISLNIGNPAAFGFRAPETLRLAMIENLQNAEGYCHQKGIFPAREAVVMQQQARGVQGVTADDVFMGNGVSELIDLVAARAAERWRRSARAEPGLSVVDRGRDAERRQGRSLSLPAGEPFRSGSGRDRSLW